MNLRERYRPVAQASNMLVISSFAALIILLIINQGLNLVNVAIGSAIILIANVVFLCSGILVPGLVAHATIVFPLNITLPIVYSAWCIVIAYLSWRLGNPLEPTLEVFRKFANLFETPQLFIFPATQILVLSLATLGNSKERAKGVDSP